MFDYEILRLIWWAVLGILLMGFAVMDGFDMGSMALMPFLGRTDTERRVIINTVGPVWEGNQVWLILGGGAIFAAWPYLYAVAFSGFYLAMLVVLLSLILRPVGFKFRSKIEDPRWRSLWDWCLFVGGVVPPVIFGVAFGNALEGVPFTFDDTMRMTYSGTFWQLLNPFALLCGGVSLCMLLAQGAAWLSYKTEKDVERRARQATMFFAILAVVLFAAAGFWVAGNIGGGINGYRFVSAIDPHGPSNPLLKNVARAPGAWLDNYRKLPASLAVPLLALLGALLAVVSARGRKPLAAFIGTSLMVMGIIGTAGVSMFPFLLPSSANPGASLTVWDASSSRGTLITMTLVTIVFLPIVLAYTSWAYYVMRGKVTNDTVKKHGDGLY